MLISEIFGNPCMGLLWILGQGGKNIFSKYPYKSYFGYFDRLDHTFKLLKSGVIEF